MKPAVWPGARREKIKGWLVTLGWGVGFFLLLSATFVFSAIAGGA
jgi:hypothetical protein